jgi:hypothetical protein
MIPIQNRGEKRHKLSTNTNQISGKNTQNPVNKERKPDRTRVMSSKHQTSVKHRSDRESGYSVKDPETPERKERKGKEKKEERRECSLSLTHLPLSVESSSFELPAQARKPHSLGAMSVQFQAKLKETVREGEGGGDDKCVQV